MNQPDLLSVALHKLLGKLTMLNSPKNLGSLGAEAEAQAQAEATAVQ